MQKIPVWNFKKNAKAVWIIVLLLYFYDLAECLAVIVVVAIQWWHDLKSYNVSIHAHYSLLIIRAFFNDIRIYMRNHRLLQ